MNEEISTTNKIAQHIDNYINANLAGNCEICGNRCKGWSWNIYYIHGNQWGLSLCHHTKKVGFAKAEGNIDDILLAGLEVMIREKWGLVK